MPGFYIKKDMLMPGFYLKKDMLMYNNDIPVVISFFIETSNE